MLGLPSAAKGNYPQFGVKDGHCRSKGLVCVSVISRVYADNLADVVDRLLIINDCSSIDRTQ